MLFSVPVSKYTHYGTFDPSLKQCVLARTNICRLIIFHTSVPEQWKDQLSKYSSLIKMISLGAFFSWRYFFTISHHLAISSNPDKSPIFLGSKSPSSAKSYQNLIGSHLKSGSDFIFFLIFFIMMLLFFLVSLSVKDTS